MRSVHDAGFEVGLHTFDHVRWQDHVAGATPEWTRAEFERGLEPSSGSSDLRRPRMRLPAGRSMITRSSSNRNTACATPAIPAAARRSIRGQTVSTCPQLPTTLPTFDELIGAGGVDESSVADTVFRLSEAAARLPHADDSQVFTLHAELEGMLLLGAFESLLMQWRGSGATPVRMAAIHERAAQKPLPARAVVRGEVAGRSGLLAVPAADMAVRA